MAVRSEDVKAAGTADPSLWLGKVGAWLIVLALGGLFFAVNGGYSVIGLDAVSRQLNGPGAVMWLLISSWKFLLPIEAPGLPIEQPAIPWLLVLGSSCLQVAIIWRKLSGKRIPTWLIALAVAMSLYDVASTFVGFGTVVWVKQAGWLLQVPLTVLFTFGLEVVVGFLLRRK